MLTGGGAVNVTGGAVNVDGSGPIDGGSSMVDGGWTHHSVGAGPVNALTPPVNNHTGGPLTRAVNH